jgi:hypothetical protein
MGKSPMLQVPCVQDHTDMLSPLTEFNAVPSDNPCSQPVCRAVFNLHVPRIATDQKETLS